MSKYQVTRSGQSQMCTPGPALRPSSQDAPSRGPLRIALMCIARLRVAISHDALLGIIIVYVFALTDQTLRRLSLPGCSIVHI